MEMQHFVVEALVFEISSSGDELEMEYSGIT